jgi:hypothetical protein
MISGLLYLDPGSGSYLIQMVIAAIVGALFYFRDMWDRIKSFFTKSSKDVTVKNDSPDE